MTPPSQDRSMIEESLVEALDVYLTDPRATRNERQLAHLCKDLIHLAGDKPEVVQYLNIKAAAALAEEEVWS